MSVSAAIDNALTGLRATQAGLNVVSQNVANAGTVGYTRRTLQTAELVAGGNSFGVDVQGTTRTLDTLVQRQLRLERAGAAYTSAKSAAHTSLDNLFDSVGGTGSLPSLVDTLSGKMQALATNPSSYVAQSDVLSAASDLAGTLNSMSGQVSTLRQNAEDAIGQDVSKASTLLGQIASLNGTVVGNPNSPSLQDQRDAMIDQLSTLMDVKVTTQPNGSVSIATTGGLQLVDGTNATKLSFDAHTLGPSSSYSTDPTKRTVGTITATDPSGATRDVVASGMIRSGDIAAQLELRDTVLPQAQAQLDGLAGGLAASLSDKTVSGTAATGAAGATGYDLDLSGLSAGNSLTVSVQDAGGTTRTLTFVKATSAAGVAAAGANGQVALDFSGGLASVATQIGTALGSHYAVTNPSGSTLRILNDGSAASVVSASAAATVTGVSTGDPQIPLFVDGGRANALFTGSFDSGSQLAGFAARIAVNPSVTANRSTLSVYGPAVTSGDATRPQLLVAQLTGTNRTFSGAAGIGGSSSPWSGTVSGFAQSIVATQASNATAASSLDSGQQVVLNAVESRFADDAGVNMDTELSNLIQLQTAYGANARVLSAANDLLTTLFRVGA